MDILQKIKEERNNYKKMRQEHREVFTARVKQLLLSFETKYNEISERNKQD